MNGDEKVEASLVDLSWVFMGTRKHCLEEDLRSRGGFLKMHIPEACLSGDE